MLNNIINTVKNWLQPKPAPAPKVSGGGGGGGSNSSWSPGYSTSSSFIGPVPAGYSQQAYHQTGQWVPTSSGGSGGSGGSSNAVSADNSSGQLTDLARQALESKINAINSRLAAMRGEGERQIGVARGIKDELLGNITNRYSGLETEAQTSRTKADAALAEEDRGTVRDYAKSQGSLNRSTERAEAANRALARATGVGNSSFYLDKQSNLKSDLVDKTAGLQNEKNAKLGSIKQRVSEVATWFEQKKTDLAHEAASLKTQAERAFQDQVGRIQFAQQTYGIDQSEAAEKALNEYEGKLASISQYIADKANQAANIASTATNQLTGIQSFQGVNPALASVLGNTTALDNATAQAGINATTATPRPVAARALTANNREDDYLYGGGSSW